MALYFIGSVLYLVEVFKFLTHSLGSVSMIKQ